MRLYLMQHGKALSRDENPEEPLSAAGIDQIKTSARAIRHLGLGFDLLICSTKRRSHQTAALVAEAVNYPYSDIVETEKVSAKVLPEETLDYLRNFEERESVFISGHLPSLARMASALLGGSAKVKFEHGGLCLIEVSEETGAGELVFCLTFEQMRFIAGAHH